LGLKRLEKFVPYRSQLEATMQSQAAETQDIHQITEEYTQRLSTLERKFQQAIRERETLWKQLEVCT
jgi:hypothetical protein